MSQLRRLGYRLFSASPSTLVNVSKPWMKAGDSLYNFKVEGVERIEELDLILYKLVHEPTLATHYHLYRDDPNNVFCIAFRTPPSDSTGVPHILEHTVLCGSQKYPVRDPFFKMLNRSMASYMNAWTASEHTAYPFCTANQQDYANLRDVYCDAVFNPHLSKMDFLQEGWRLEHADPTNPESAIQFKGVVYNEMKGALSDSESLFATRVQQRLFPGSTYGYVSGGDPPNIIDLTHDQLKKFHAAHYHPSNALFYTYGNFPLEDSLMYIDKKLCQFKKGLAHKVSLPQGWTPPRNHRVNLSCPLDPIGNPNRQTKMSISFLANEIGNEAQESFHLGLLSYLLLDGSSSPMYKALIDSNLGQEYSSNIGYDTHTKLSSFSFGLQGIKDSEVELVERTIYNVLEDVLKNGFEKDRIDAALHLLELNTKHQSSQFGLALSHKIISSWVYDGRPEDALHINKKIERFKEAFARGGLFEGLIKKYFIDNEQKVTVVMSPEAQFSKQLQQAENDLLAQKVSKLTNADKAELFETNQELLKLQEGKEDLSCLPSLSLDDLGRFSKSFPFREFALSGSPRQFTRTSSTANGITFFNCIIPISNLSNLKLLPLMCESLTDLGVEGKSLEKFDQDIKMYSGGLRSSLFLGRQPFNRESNPEIGLSLGTHALDRNVSKAMELLSESILKTDFSNHARLKTLIASSSSSMMNSIASSGHSYAMKVAASGLNQRNCIDEETGGLTQAFFMSELSESDKLDLLASQLKEMSQEILSTPPQSWRMAVVCTNEADATNHAFVNFASSIHLPGPSSIASATFDPDQPNVLVTMPFSTNFTAKVYQFNPYDLKTSAHLALLSKIFRSRYLHREIREKGGAYGGGANYSTLNGLFSFYSYRDPNPLNSLKCFDSTMNWFEGYQLTEQEVLEAQLSVISALDAPADVESEGMHSFWYGISDVDRQLFRDQVFTVTKDSLKQLSLDCFANGTPSRSCVIGEAEKEEELKDSLLSRAGWELKKFKI